MASPLLSQTLCAACPPQVPPERTQQLAACSPPSLVSWYTHGGAHLVPTCSGEFKAALVDFLEGVRGVTAQRAPAGGRLTLLNAPAPMHRVASQSSMKGSASEASMASTDAEGTDKD